MAEQVEGTEEEKKKGGAWGKTAKVSLGVLGGLSLLMGYISAAGMKESEREAEARKPVDEFFAAFNARDLERGRRTLHYPHIQIAGNDVMILNEPESFQIRHRTNGTEDADNWLTVSAKWNTLGPSPWNS